MQIPDASKFPTAYRDALLALVGDRDPLALLGETEAMLERAAEEYPWSAWRVRPFAGEWSASDLLGHFFDVELVHSFRWRLVLTADEPVYPGYDEKAWAGLAKPGDGELLGAWRAIRRANLVLLHSLEPRHWIRRGIHAEQGKEDFETLVRKLAGHDLAHLDQLRRTLEVVSQQMPPSA